MDELMSRTLRARDNGAADSNPRVGGRFAPHNNADQADIGRKSLRLFRPRGLSAAPLGISGIFTRHVISDQSDTSSNEPACDKWNSSIP